MKSICREGPPLRWSCSLHSAWSNHRWQQTRATFVHRNRRTMLSRPRPPMTGQSAGNVRARHSEQLTLSRFLFRLISTFLITSKKPAWRGPFIALFKEGVLFVTQGNYRVHFRRPVRGDVARQHAHNCNDPHDRGKRNHVSRFNSEQKTAE